MGLDWCLCDKPLNEEVRAEVERLRSELDKDMSVERNKALRAELRPLVVTPLQALGAITLTLDNPKSIEFFREIYDSHAGQPDWDKPFDEKVTEYLGRVLVNSIDPTFKKMIPALNSPFACLSGVESFRGKRIGNCYRLPQELRDSAYVDKNPREMLNYSKELFEHFKSANFDAWNTLATKLNSISDASWTGNHAKPGHTQEEVNKLLEEIPDEYYELVAIKEASEWLTFWGSQGFSMWAWY